MRAVDCDNVSFFRGRTPVLHDVSFCLEPGRLLGLFGHNGAGKSTLIKLILGLLRPDQGHLTVLGQRPGQTPLRIGYLPENVSFYPTMTVREHCRYFAQLKSVAPERVSQLVESLGLTGVLEQRLSQCSKGQRQRLGLAQALLSRPEMLIFDEPTVGLDPSASASMYAELSALRDAGCTVIVCTHELALVEPCVDEVLMLRRGRIQAYGDLAGLRQQAQMPVRVQVPNRDFFRDRAEFAPLLHGGGLLVPEPQLADVVRLLTQKYGCFDFQIQRADLVSLYEHFVVAGSGEIPS